MSNQSRIMFVLYYKNVWIGTERHPRRIGRVGDRPLMAGLLFLQQLLSARLHIDPSNRSGSKCPALLSTMCEARSSMSFGIFSSGMWSKYSASLRSRVRSGGSLREFSWASRVRSIYAPRPTAVKQQHQLQPEDDAKEEGARHDRLMTWPLLPHNSRSIKVESGGQQPRCSMLPARQTEPVTCKRATPLGKRPLEWRLWPKKRTMITSVSTSYACAMPGSHSRTAANRSTSLM